MSVVEEWRRVPTDPDYEASSLGRVRSWRRSRGRVLTQKPSGPSRYLTVRIRVNGKNRITQVHRLVALAFYGPRPDGLVTRHLDGNSHNNQAANLRYGTRSENELDKVRHGTHPEARKTHCANGHEYTPVNTFRHTSDKPTWRRCVTCKRINDRAYKARLTAVRHTGEVAA